MEPVLTVSDVRKHYDNRFVLGPLNFSLEPGYITAVVGPNGSGKSTLFRMLMSLAYPDEGSIRLFGRSYPENGVEIKRRTGYVPELSEWDDSWRTVKDAVRFYSHWYPNWQKDRFQELMQLYSLDPKLRFKGMSKGVRRKLSIALAMAHDPDLLLLDEPSSGLDPFASRAMVEDIHRFMESGSKSVLMATHIMDEVKKLADYVIFICYGQQLGMYEKDVLLDEWKAVWVERSSDRSKQFPGVMESSGSGPVRIVTSSFEETRQALAEEGNPIIKTESLELDEIFYHLMNKHGVSAGKERGAG
ncbi:ABC transporter ATP-binding protein [Chlamydia abortus]|uniref:ABC transporter ATP-binding protein n=1 Tax=Paenibacillus residui TaxID=629724 RepID=A0ABW3D624_9BACL|nr:ABC transporter ATP-binding protein [Chlamydia abortus]